MAGTAKTLTLFALLALSLSSTYAASSGAFSGSDLVGTLARSLLRKYMDVETTPFHDVFEARFRR